MPRTKTRGRSVQRTTRGRSTTETRSSMARKCFVPSTNGGSKRPRRKTISSEQQPANPVPSTNRGSTRARQQTVSSDQQPPLDANSPLTRADLPGIIEAVSTHLNTRHPPTTTPEDDITPDTQFEHHLSK